MTRALVQSFAALALATVQSGCSTSSGATSVLQSSDLSSSGVFDPDEIVASAAMKDATTVGSAELSAFLRATPYGGASFLSYYSSHGVSAVAAMVAAAQSYQLDPILFLVRAEMDQGLIASTGYPSPPSRVEFAFGCGCDAPGDCDPSFAGFDVQVGCLAEAIRESLDAVAAHGKTDGGWGPGIASTTLDGVKVTPKDDSTAALYQYTPAVAKGQAGGNWLVWNLWQRYAHALGYSGPPAGGGGWIGDSCTSSSTCSYGGTPGTCATQFPGGLCTLACTGACPSATGQPGTFCADFGSQGGFCLAVCTPAASSCRSGYTCESVKQFGDTSASQNVCFP